MTDNPHDECCKGTAYMDRISVYLKRDTILNESNASTVNTALINVLGYTLKQANTAIQFANTRGECLLFEGSQQDAIDYMNQLIQLGIHCVAKSRGHSK